MWWNDPLEGAEPARARPVARAFAASRRLTTARSSVRDAVGGFGPRSESP